MLDADPDGHHGLPRGSRRALATERGQHLRWDRAENGCQGEMVVAVLHLLTVVRLDRVPDPGRLHVHLHEHLPLLIVGVVEHRVLDGGVGHLDSAPDDDLRPGSASTRRGGERQAAAACSNARRTAQTPHHRAFLSTRL